MIILECGRRQLFHNNIKEIKKHTLIPKFFVFNKNTKQNNNNNEVFIENNQN